MNYDSAIMAFTARQDLVCKSVTSWFVSDGWEISYSVGSYSTNRELTATKNNRIAKISVGMDIVKVDIHTCMAKPYHDVVGECLFSLRTPIYECSQENFITDITAGLLLLA